MDEREFKERTKKLALRIIRLVEALSQGPSRGMPGYVIGKQLLRSGTSIGANYRAACRGKSAADVIAKLAIVEEEADETLYWFELLAEAKIMPEEKIALLVKETDEILAMTVVSIKTLRRRDRLTEMERKTPDRVSNPKSKIQNPK